MFKIFSSSAGSGKTYTLTREYLKLALGDRRESERKPFEIFQYKHILAVTFTNAAANEMKERILKELRCMASGGTGPMPDEVAAELGLEPAELQKRAKAVFHSILHDYSAFAVLTIDSFVQRVVTAFTDDLELPYSFEVEMDTDAVLQTAIERLIEKVGQDEHGFLSEVIEEYFRENAADGRSWYALSGTLADFSKNQLNDRNYDFVQQLADLEPADFRVIRKQLREFIQSVENEIQQIAASGYSLIQAHNIPDEDFYRKATGVGTYFRERALEPGFPKPANSYVREALNNDKWYTAKKHETIDAIKNILGNYIQQIEDFRAQNVGKYVMYDQIEKHLQKIALLKQIRQECAELLREQNRVHISEFNRLILNVVSCEPVPFIYERLGEKYHHILVDEFQDTSRLQFNNLLPLIENNLGYDRFNLAVGDAKQAIYRFRGGDMDQLVALHGQNLDRLIDQSGELNAERLRGIHRYLAPDRLSTNYRSAESIVAFNNTFFGYLAAIHAGTEYGQVTEVFDSAFSQKAHKEGTPGHVQIDFIPKPVREKGAPEPTGPDVAEQMAEKTLALVRQALNDGYQPGDIAILCRRKKEARLLANHLEDNDIPLISEDSLTLNSSERVRFLVALMTLLQRPDDRLVRYDLLFLFHRLIEHDVPDEALAGHIDELAKVDDSAMIFSYLKPLLKEPLDLTTLAQQSVYELAEKLALYFELFDCERDCAYLFRFLDEVLIFSQKFSSHLADFLTYWETAQDKISVVAPAHADAVTITTIHKSKGLEYPVVIIPFANWSYKPHQNEAIWMALDDLEELRSQREDGETKRLTTVTVGLANRLEDTPLAHQYRDELYRTFVECMNLLYVALTRPTDRMYLISVLDEYVGKDGKPKRSDGIDYWFYQFLKDQPIGEQGWEEGRLSYALYEHLTKPDMAHRRAALTGTPVSVHTYGREGDRPLRLRRLTEQIESGMVSGQEWQQKVCQALSLLKTPACIDKCIRRLITEGHLRASESDSMKQTLAQILAHPILAEFFLPDLRIDGNRPVLRQQGRLSGAHRVVHLPDRTVLFIYQAGHPTSSHRESLSYLTDLYSRMGYVNVEGKIVYVGDEIKVVSMSELLAV